MAKRININIGKEYPVKLLVKNLSIVALIGSTLFSSITMAEQKVGVVNVEAIFQQIEGVEKVVSGYSGGTVPGTPTYREVSSGRTGHAEVIKLTYDPEIIPYADLLRIFFSTHDPTTLNRQGYDQGTQYRSVIFFQDEKEKEVAKGVMEEMKDYFDDPIVTELSALEAFYVAESDHQNYYNDHRNQGYCTAIIDPKVAKLRAMFASRLKPEMS